MEISFEAKYPRKSIRWLSKYAGACMTLSEMEFPMGEKAGKLENGFYRRVFTFLALVFGITFLVCYKINHLIFKDPESDK